MELAYKLSKSNVKSDFYSFDIDNFLKTLDLSVLENAYLTKLLGRCTITKNGIDLNSCRYDSQDNLAKFIGCSLRTVQRIEKLLVDKGLLLKTAGRHPTNPFLKRRFLYLSNKLKQLIIRYVNPKKVNNSRKRLPVVSGDDSVSYENKPHSQRVNQNNNKEESFEVEEDTVTEIKEKADPSEFHILVKLWNAHCKELPKIDTQNVGLTRLCNARWKDKPNEQYWKDVFTKAAESSFLNEQEWSCLKWVLSGKKDQKEGKYFSFKNHEKIYAGRYTEKPLTLQKKTYQKSSSSLYRSTTGYDHIDKIIEGGRIGRQGTND